MIVRVQVHVRFPYWRHIHFRNRVPVRNYFRDWFDFHACLLYEEPELVRGELVLGNPSWRWTGCCYVLGGGGCAFVLVYLEARHHLIYACVGVVEAQFVNCSAGFPVLKMMFLDVVFEVIPCFVHQICAFSCLYIVFENSLFVEDNKA